MATASHRQSRADGQVLAAAWSYTTTHEPGCRSVLELQLDLLLLSPHRDDAAFSLSGSIQGWLGSGHRVTLLNVFTRSAYAPFADLSGVSPANVIPHVSLLRKREDEAFLRALPGLAMVDLDLEDAPLRLLCDVSSVCDQQALDDDPIMLTIQNAIEHEVYGRMEADLSAPLSSAALIIPLGLGRHIDHLVVRNAALQFLHSVPVAFYEELPYAMRANAADDLQVFMKRLPAPLAPMVGSPQSTTTWEGLQSRLDLVQLYRSQIDAQEAHSIASFPQRSPGSERIWVNPAWLASPMLTSMRTPQVENNASKGPSA